MVKIHKLKEEYYIAYAKKGDIFPGNVSHAKKTGYYIVFFGRDGPGDFLLSMFLGSRKPGEAF